MRPFLALSVPLVLVPLALISLAACGSEAAGVPANGTGPQRSFAVADFDSVAAAGSDDVAIRTGAGFSVRAEGDPAVLDHLRIVREGHTLRIGREPGWHPTVTGSAKVFVTMPRLVATDVAGSGNIVVDRVTGPSFKAETAGSGDLTVHAIAADAVSLSIAGSGDMALAGRVRHVDVSVAGAGDVDAGGLVASGASVSIAGSGNVHVRVDGPAKVSLIGSGDVDLGPAAHCSVTKMGSGSVRCGG